MEAPLDKSNHSVADVQCYLVSKQTQMHQPISYSVSHQNIAYKWNLDEGCTQSVDQNNHENNFRSKFRKITCQIKNKRKSSPKLCKKSLGNSNIMNHFSIVKELKKRKDVKLIDLMFENRTKNKEQNKCLTPTSIKLSQKKQIQFKPSTQLKVCKIEFQHQNNKNINQYNIHPMFYAKRKLKRAIPKQKKSIQQDSRLKTYQFYKRILNRNKITKPQKMSNPKNNPSLKQPFKNSINLEMMNSIVASRIILPIRPTTCKPIFQATRAERCKRIARVDEALGRWDGNEEDYAFN